MKIREINFFGDDAVMSNPSGSEPHQNSPPEMAIITQPRGSRSYMMTNQMYNNNNNMTTRSQPQQIFPMQAHNAMPISMIRHGTQFNPTRYNYRVSGAPETSMDMYLRGGTSVARHPYDVVPYSSVASGAQPIRSFPSIQFGSGDEEHDGGVPTMMTRYLLGALDQPINPYYPYLALTKPFDHVHAEVNLDLKL